MSPSSESGIHNKNSILQIAPKSVLCGAMEEEAYQTVFTENFSKHFGGGEAQPDRPTWTPVFAESSRH